MENNQESELTEKEYRIPITWMSSKEYKIKASSLAEAAVLGVKQFLSESDPNYINDSYIVDDTITEINKGDPLDFDKLYADIIKSI